MTFSPDTIILIGATSSPRRMLVLVCSLAQKHDMEHKCNIALQYFSNSIFCTLSKVLMFLSSAFFSVIRGLLPHPGLIINTKQDNIHKVSKRDFDPQQVLQSVKSLTSTYLRLDYLMVHDQFNHQKNDCIRIFWNSQIFLVLKSAAFLIKTKISAKWIFIF